MRYFVTGATGFIGERLVRQLLRDGHEVVALVRTPAKAAGLAAAGASLRQGDITDKQSMRDGMRGVDGVFHAAAWYKIGAPSAQAEAINVGGTRNVLELMRELDIPRGVYTSTLAVFGDTHGRVVDETYTAGGPFLSVYDRTKWQAHYEVALPMMRAGLPLVIVQPGLNYGPGDTSSVRDSWIQYLTGKLPAIPQVTAYCWAYVDDTVRGHIQAMANGRHGEAYIIAGPAHTLVDAMLTAERLTGIPAPRLRVKPGVFGAAAALMRVVEKVVPVPDMYTAESFRVLAGATYLGTSAKAERELGFTARSIADGLAITLEHERALLAASR